MGSYLLELKSICKNFKVLVLIAVLLAYQVMFIAQVQSDNRAAVVRETRINTLYSSLNNSWVEYWGKRHQYLQEYGMPPGSISPELDIDKEVTLELAIPPSSYTVKEIKHNLAWYQYEKQIADRITESFTNKDWSAYNLSMIEKNTLDWFLFNLDKKSGVKPEQFFAGDWDLCNSQIDKPEFNEPPYWVEKRETPLRPISIFTTAYHLSLLKEDLPPVEVYSLSPWGFTFNFLRKGLPNILGIIVLLLTVNLIHRDRKFGTIKSSLQVPKSRVYYLFRRISQGFISSIGVVFLPQLLIFSVLGLRNGFLSLDFPALLNRDYLEWKLPLQYLTHTLKGNTTYYEFGLSRYQLPWNPALINLPLHRLEIVTLRELIGPALALLAVFILFCTVLGLLISVLIRNETLAQLVAIGAFALGTALGNIFPNIDTTHWDIFAKADIIPLLEGGHLSTYLGSMVTISIATILLFALVVIVFRKQDIPN